MVKTIVLLMIMFFSVNALFAADHDARQILDNLYRPSGQMPIQDMVVELEESVASGAETNLVAAGKDKIYFKAPSKLRIDAVIFDPGGSLDRKNMIIIRDGKMAWQYLSTGQYPVKKKQDEPSAPLNLPFNIVRYPQDIEKQYAVSGSEVVDNVSTSVVKITSSSSGEETTVCVDRNRNVPLKLVMKKKDDKGKEVVKKVLYKQIGKTKDGRFFPFKLEIYVNEALTRVVEYKALAINAGLDDGLFAPMEKFVK